MATAEQFLAKAAGYIGISGTDNIFNTWYWGKHCYDGNIYPWCAAFQSYVGVHDLEMPFNPSASAAGVANQGTRVADEDARPGDWVLFNWDGRQDFGWADHIGVVEWTDIAGSGYFGTIEGNCDDQVKRCTRYNYGSYATAFFRPPYDEKAEPHWVENDKGWWYDNGDGTYPASTWMEIDGKHYYFDKNGYMVTGWLSHNGKRYYLQPKTSKTGNSYGHMVVGAHTIGGKRYWFDAKGVMFKDGFRQGASGKYWYAYAKDGHMLTAQSIKADSKGRIKLP